MGKTKGNCNAEFPKGSKVRVAGREYLLRFLNEWSYHNKLQPEQLEYGGKEAVVEAVGFYFGGYELYKLKNIPGIWHEQCLREI
jgi:hypothetical protein